MTDPRPLADAPHGVSIVLAHGDGCEGCRAIRRLVLDRSEGATVTVASGVACLSRTTVPMVGERWCHLLSGHGGQHQNGAHQWG